MPAVTSASDCVWSSPSQTFSAAVSVSKSEKCWNTIAMPSARAAWGFAISTGRPPHPISPSSGLTTP
jgi:hypothetical protein